MKKANAVSRVFAWFKHALSSLLGFLRQIPTLFLNAFKALEIMDIVLAPRAFTLIEVGKFAFSVLGITWAGNRAKFVKVLGPTGESIMKGLETTFDVVVALVTRIQNDLIRTRNDGFPAQLQSFMRQVRPSTGYRDSA